MTAGPETLVHGASPWDGDRFDPATHIRAVNGLWALSKDAALAALGSFARAHAGDVLEHTRVFFLLRLLFEPPEGEPFPPIRVGTPTDPAPPDPRAVPRYPLALVRGVPLLLARGFVLGGLAESPEGHLAFCAEHCRLRSEPLRPPDDPTGLVDEVLAASWWQRPAQPDRALLRGQIARLTGGGDQVAAAVAADAEWERHVAAFRARGARWDGTRYA